MMLCTGLRDCAATLYKGTCGPLCPLTPAPNERSVTFSFSAMHMFEQLQFRLPLELVLDIVDNLASPDHPDAYGYSPEVLKSLLSLCLVSQLVNRVATRHLYNRIFFTSLVQMKHFLDFDHSSRVIRSMGFAASIPINQIDTKLIWKTYGPNIQRLSLEGQIHWFSYQPDAVTSHVEEVALIPGGQRYFLELWSAWTDFRALKRMAVMHAILQDYGDNASYYDRLADVFPHLETLVITLSSRNKKQLACFDRLLSCLPSLRRVVVVEPLRQREYPPAWEIVEEEIGRKHADRLEIVEVTGDCCAEAGCFKRWFAGKVRDGRIWEMSGMVWGKRGPCVKSMLDSPKVGTSFDVCLRSEE